MSEPGALDPCGGTNGGGSYPDGGTGGVPSLPDGLCHWESGRWDGWSVMVSPWNVVSSLSPAAAFRTPSMQHQLDGQAKHDDADSQVQEPPGARVAEHPGQRPGPVPQRGEPRDAAGNGA